VFLQDRAGIGHEKLMEARNQFLGMAAQSKVLAGASERPERRAAVSAEIDDEKASALGVTIADINSTLSIALGAATSTTSSTAAG
jgi:multidrug efflux pump